MLEVVQKIASDAGTLALSYFERLSEVPVESKGHLDLVTAADRVVEQFIASRLQEAFPADGIFGEEGSAVTGTSGRTWVVDPIDGTFNFVRRGDQWAVSIGLYENGRPDFGVVYAPVRKQMLTGGRGRPARLNGQLLPRAEPLDRDRACVGVGFHPVIPIEDRLEVLRTVMEDLRMKLRCCGSATISLLEVATGQADGYIGSGESTWDVMAILPALETIGIGSSLDWSGTRLSSKLRFACGTPDFLSMVPPKLLRPLT